jgi:outer membrane protein OmpA-like peptidoglycan-associated protein
VSFTKFMSGIRAPIVLAALLGAAMAHATSANIPLVPGVTFVLAVSNKSSPTAGKISDVLQGDYEMVVTITKVNVDEITQAVFFAGTDARGDQRSGTIARVVSTDDLASSRLQILGFHLDDPLHVAGATSLGPSLDVTRELAGKGATVYSFRNFAGRETISGTLRRSSTSLVKFPVLLNGKRLELDAIHATGQMALGSGKRPFETVILDHPWHPLSLRVAYGPRDGRFPFAPDFAREIVRIDLPGGEVPRSAFDEDCRVELQGLYFDFNQATLNPQSDRGLREIAAALRATQEARFTIEGHTDNIGSGRHNDDLSARRAAAVKAALVRDYGVDAVRLSTAGHGARRPIESNDTLAGRARNRRVELVCARVE